MEACLSLGIYELSAPLSLSAKGQALSVQGFDFVGPLPQFGGLKAEYEASLLVTCTDIWEHCLGWGLWDVCA